MDAQIKKSDLDILGELLLDIYKATPNLFSFAENLKKFRILLEAVVENKKIVIGKDVCCKTCPDWRPAHSIIDENGEREISIEEAGIGWCMTSANTATHDNHTSCDFFCSDHPFFRRDK